MTTQAKGAGRAVLRRLVNDEHFIAEPRTEQMRSLAVVQDPAVITALEAVFEGTDVMGDERKATLLVQVRNEVAIEWSRAKQSFLSIGKALLAVEAALAPDEFKRLSRNAARVFPFSETTASQLRQVARAVMSGRVTEAEMPGSYSVAYQLALMDCPTIELARSRNLVRPTVTRGELISFRREMHIGAALPAVAQPPSVADERARLQKLRSELMEQVAQIEIRLVELQSGIQ